MDISTPDWEISVLDNTKIPENSEKSEFFVGVQKFKKNLHKVYKNE